MNILKCDSCYQVRLKKLKSLFILKLGTEVAKQLADCPLGVGIFFS